MSEILSQDEVDSLLSGLGDGDVESETDLDSPDPDGVDGYDFTSQDRVIRGRMPTLDVINERFSREVRASMTGLLNTNVDISAEPLDTLKFSEFGRSLPVPTSLHVFRMEPLRGHGLLVLESQLVFNLIDTFFGGDGSSNARVEGREFTTIEEVMINKVVRACLKNLMTAWLPVEQITISLIRSEVNPQFAAIVNPTDLVIVTRFEIELEQSAGTLIVCIPYAMIEPLRSKLSAGFQAEQESVDMVWQDRLKEIILESTVNFNVQLGSTEIVGERLIMLKPGDVIQLDQDAVEHLTANIEGLPKLKGVAGLQRGFQAFQVMSRKKMR
ncbi:MAG: flagellar motor switch protein FliM [Desulfobacteraceae bacterium 4572_19]|nr:MAG: flagellar motor switch protein FliM [Desulfobacteraceae bacterium 4572_19]